MIFGRRLAMGAVILAVVLGWGCHDTTSPSAPSPQVQQNPPASPAPTPTPVSPTHTLTLTASPSCSTLPQQAHVRTYPVQVKENPGGEMIVLVVNSYDIMVGWANEAGFNGTRTGNSVRFLFTDDLMAPYAMIERIPAVGDMGYVGTATGTIDNNRIVATFNGVYRLNYGAGPVLCEAVDHRVEMTPR